MVMRGIEEGWLYAPLDQFLLSRPEDALIALDIERFASGSEAIAMWRACYDGPTSTTNVPDTARAAEALARSKMLSGQQQPTKSKRTLRRYRAVLKTAQGNVRALASKPRPGNRKPRISEPHTDMLRQSVARHHASAIALSCTASYLQYQLDFEEKRASGVFKEGEFALSLRGYRERVRKMDQEALANSRGGNRGGNAAAEPVDRDKCIASAQRPFEIAHADHYLGDRKLLMRLSGGRAWSRKPWVSVLRDGRDLGDSRRIPGAQPGGAGRAAARLRPPPPAPARNDRQRLRLGLPVGVLRDDAGRPRGAQEGSSLRSPALRG